MTNAARQRRYRNRQRDDLAVVPVEVHHPTVTAELVDAGLLGERDIDDRAKVSKALSRAIELLCVARYLAPQ